jgi:hypothetical protein
MILATNENKKGMSLLVTKWMMVRLSVKARGKASYH